jgi:hypothetical protein
MVAALGREHAGDGSPVQKAHRLVAFLSRRCAYSLDGLSIPPGASPIEWFLQDGRKGSCEHFASALAVMLRGCGIPSRVVTGFLVHEFNITGGYYIVRASDAHAWVEYYAGGAWRTCEATPQSVAPTGRESSIFDALRFAWIRWVIRYSLTDQIHLASRITEASASFDFRVGLVLGVTCGAASFTFVLWIISFAVKRKRTGSYGIVTRAFARKGVHLPWGRSHEEHLELVMRQWPQLGDEFRTYLETYLQHRFGRGSADISAATARLVEAIRKSARPSPR